MDDILFWVRVNNLPLIDRNKYIGHLIEKDFRDFTNKRKKEEERAEEDENTEDQNIFISCV